MKFCVGFAIICFSGILPIYAENGMGLIVASTGQFEREGSIRRIDVSNSQVINTTGAIGYGMYPRFAPDGNTFAFLSGTTVTIADLNGAVIRSFPVGGSSANSKLSFTNNGIYIAGAGQIRLYDPATGALKSQKAQATGFTGSAYISQNGTMASSTESYGYASGQWGVSFQNLSTGATAKGPLGCSAGPSPSGALGTNNLWETGKEHRTMYILNSSNGSVAEHLDIGEILGLGSNYCWNTQCWSGNSEQIIILPVGGWGNQVTNFCEPWIYNRVTGEAIQLANRSGSNDFWQPYDFYSGKLPGPASPALNVSPTSLAFTGSIGGAGPASQNVTVTNSGAGTLNSVTTSIAYTTGSGWLTVTRGGTGNAQTLLNTVSIGSLVKGSYSATVTVNCANASPASKTYQVSFALSGPPTFPLKINCGENSLTPAGWENDESYKTGGADHTFTTTFVVAGVANAAPANVYKSCVHRNGTETSFTYNINAVPNGTYTVRMHFGDEYSNRSIDVSINGAQVINNLDIATDAGGANRALVKQSVVTVSAGKIELRFSSDRSTNDDFFINGIEVVQGNVPILNRVNTRPAHLALGSGNTGITFYDCFGKRISWPYAQRNGASIAGSSGIRHASTTYIMIQSEGRALKGVTVKFWDFFSRSTELGRLAK